MSLSNRTYISDISDEENEISSSADDNFFYNINRIEEGFLSQRRLEYRQAVSAVDCFIFVDDLTRLLETLRACREHYELKCQTSESQDRDLLLKIKETLKKVLTETMKMLSIQEGYQIDGVIRECNELMEEIKQNYANEEEETKKKWDNIRAAMQVFANREYQCAIFANRMFESELEEPENNHLSSEGYLFLKNVCEFHKTSSRESLPTVHLALTHGRDIMLDLMAYRDYQAFANSVEGKPSTSCKLLGYAMKAFGAFVFVGGLIGTAAALAFCKPSGFLSLGLCAVTALVMWGGVKGWKKGDEYIEKGKQSGFSLQVRMFGESVSNANKREARKRVDKNDGDVPLLRWNH